MANQLQCTNQWFAPGDRGWGRGEGQPAGNLTFVNFPTLGSPFKKSNSHPWETQTLHRKLNEMIASRNKFIVALLQTVIVLVGKWSSRCLCISPNEECIF